MELTMRTACILPLLLVSPLPAADWYVSAIRGKDTNAGTFRAPFQTIGRATAAAQSADTIHLLAGRYTPTLGERFPVTLPAGVHLIGIDPRTCVIDAEFDPSSTNNKVTGTIVRILDKSRFAYVSVINGARNPSDPGKEWWKMAIVVEGQSGNSSDVEIDHVILDEVSRGIVCGQAFGGANHDMKNIKIHDCVLQRFYVEAVNSWVQQGAASGNQIWNCTLIGHQRPQAPNKPYPRASMSFGPGAQFDVRNCVVYRADWAGIEAGSATAKITSDHNCLHGGGWAGFAAHRGVAKGSNDLFVDPALAAPATVAARADPHQTSTSSPLWRKGVNFPGQDKTFDIDFQGPRLFASIVDIGADEWTGPDAYFLGLPKIGNTIRIGLVGQPSQPTILALGFKALTQGIKVPGFQGELRLDPSLPILIGIAPKNAAGYAWLPLPIPNDQALLRLELDLQGIDLPQQQFSDLDQINVIN